MRKPNIYFVITIDTEADHRPDWTKSDPLSFKAVTEAIPERIEPLFKKYGAVGTYLLTTEVLENEKAVETLRSLEAPAELGTHLHAEYIEPQKRFFKYEGTYSTDFSDMYDPEIERGKLISITDLFRKKIGYSPKVYRGGKFGFGDNTADSLAGLGYAVDTSVTPRVSWRAIGGPDFRGKSDQPYFIDFRKGDKRLLEVPISIAYLNPIHRLLNRPTWLRASFGSSRAMRLLIENFIKRYKERKAVVLNMMFHCMELYPSASPYAVSEEDCHMLSRRLEETLAYCRDMDARFCGLSGIRSFYET